MEKKSIRVYLEPRVVKRGKVLSHPLGTDVFVDFDETDPSVAGTWRIDMIGRPYRDILGTEAVPVILLLEEKGLLESVSEKVMFEIGLSKVQADFRSPHGVILTDLGEVAIDGRVAGETTIRAIISASSIKRFRILVDKLGVTDSVLHEWVVVGDKELVRSTTHPVSHLGRRIVRFIGWLMRRSRLNLGHLYTEVPLPPSVE